MTISRVYGAMILVLAGVTIWGAFDTHNRLPVIILTQALVLGMRAVWKFSKQS